MRGPQKHEAWSSGEAALTGDTDFDDAFIVLAARPERTDLQFEAQRIPASVRAALLHERQRGGLRDAEIWPERVVLTARASGQRPRAPSRRERIAWTLGSLFLGIGKIPSARDLEDAISRAVRLAEALEAT